MSNKKHKEMIVCIKSGLVSHRTGGFVDYELVSSDLMLGQRAALENDEDFRQVLPISVFTHQGKVWAYERTPKGGESRLHNKVAVAVGGHWDLADVVAEGSVVNLEASLSVAIQRELDEEIELTSQIVSTRKMSKLICADDTEVDRVHIAMITVHELDGEGLASAEDQLKAIGFVDPGELIADDRYDLEVWARLICELLENDNAIN